MILTILRCQWPGTMRPVAQAVPRLAMFGHICQLHYHSGGVVAYRSQNGTAAKVQFHAVRTGPPLKIGQAVTFSVANGDAINITAVDAGGAAVASSRSPEPIGLRKTPNGCSRRSQSSAMPRWKSNLTGYAMLKRSCIGYCRTRLACEPWYRSKMFQTHTHMNTDAQTHTHTHMHAFFWGRHPLI